MENFYLFGKGELAIYCAEKYLTKYKKNNLKIIPTLPEPTWTESLTQWAQINGIRVLDFDEIKESSLEENSIGLSIFYDKIFKKERCVYKILNRRKSVKFGTMFLECFGVKWFENYTELEINKMFKNFKKIKVVPFGYNFPKLNKKNLTGNNKFGYFHRIHVIK